ncbi:MAG: fumarylacetoacetate hydrolase family protein [Planctomycetota bacterium]|jgi:2-keto-4-pentenoate hydratase/2-oxohepta-3-ene-1,7-dioic acid hydratase in catechol pathway
MATYVRFRNAENPDGVYGEVNGDQVTLLDAAPLDGGKPTGSTVPLGEITEWMVPGEPANVICIGANYADHCKESDVDLPTEPLIFIKPTTSLTAHETPVLLPPHAADEVDYEAELVVIIGKEARKVSEEDALDYVFGYTTGNDISARDCQLRRDRQWARGKGFDTFAPCGPFVVTELDPTDVSIKTVLNGETLQDGNTRDMIFNVPFLISYLSHQFTLLPGTMIYTGTPDGVGAGRDPQIFLKDGDSIDVTVEGVGTLRNSIKLDS